MVQQLVNLFFAVIKTVKNLIKKTGIKGESIIGIGVDSQREAIVPLNAKGEKLMNSIIWLDKWTIPIAEDIKKYYHKKK